MKRNILNLFRHKSTILSFSEISLLLDERDENKLARKISYYVKTGKLYRIRRGLYSKNEEYNRLELATKIYVPSYVSFETVLRSEGIIFQHYESIYCASYLSREIEVSGQKYKYRRIKEEVLTNPSGVIEKDEYYIATKERAFLDQLYLNENYFFDNLSLINWEKCFELVKIYKRKNLEKKIKEYAE